MPRIVAADFIAPNATGTAFDEFDAYLTLFTLNFARQQPPFTSCSITGFDAAGNTFSQSLNFGCWTRTKLEDIGAEFAYPNLGQLPAGGDEHGWLQINCNSDGASGGGHGSLAQVEPAGTTWGGAAATSTPTAWSRTLIQSVTTGDSVSLEMGSSQPASAVAAGGER